MGTQTSPATMENSVEIPLKTVRHHKNCLHLLEKKKIMPSFPSTSDGKESACNEEDWCSISGLGNPLEKGKATHSSILAWRIPRMAEPRGLPSWGHTESDTTEVT